MSKKIALSIMCCCAMFPCFASQADPAVDLNNLMSQLATLEVDFQQQIRSQDSNELLDENSGSLIVKRPGYFYVHTKEPYEEIITSDGKVIWTYDVDLSQATQEQVDDRLQQTPFLLLSGNVEAIRENFTVSQSGHETGNGAPRFSLSPKDSNASYNDVELQFNDKGVLTAMAWNNSLSEHYTIQFDNIEVNRAIADKQFEFTPPAGVDVEIKDAATATQP